MRTDLLDDNFDGPSTSFVVPKRKFNGKVSLLEPPKRKKRKLKLIETESEPDTSGSEAELERIKWCCGVRFCSRSKCVKRVCC